MLARLIGPALTAVLILAANPSATAQVAAGLIYEQPLSPAALRMVQERLRQAGGYAGGTDGIWGPDSQTALERFQQTHGLQANGRLNQATVATLGLNATELLAASGPTAPVAPLPPVAAGAPVSVPPPIAAGAQLSQRSVRAVQERLRGLNFYNGRVDGLWGGDTQEAIQRFQQGRGLQPNGQLNAATVSALGLNAADLSPALR